MRPLKIEKRISQRDGNTFSLYLKEIEKYNLLTLEEEKELTLKAKNNDPIAIDKLVKSNLRFVVSVAKQYQNKGLPLEDLINEGNEGLMKAVSKFEPSKEIKFISYAVHWIRQTILMALAEHSRIVRLPQNKLSNLYKINRAVDILHQKLEREPTADEISKSTELESDVVNVVLTSIARPASLDSPIEGRDDNFTLNDIISSGETHNIDDFIKIEDALGDAIDSLPDRERQILRLYYGINCDREHTLDEIAEVLNPKLSKERIRQLKVGALRRLRTNRKTKKLRRFLES